MILMMVFFCEILNSQVTHPSSGPSMRSQWECHSQGACSSCSEISPFRMNHRMGDYNVIKYVFFFKIKCIKGEVRQFFYRLKVFIGPKLREDAIGNFHWKAPKWAKNQAKVSKIDQIRPPLHRTYCGNPPILSSELLWESNYQQVDAKGVLFGQFLTLWPDFWPTLGLFGEHCLLRLLLVWGQ